MLDKLDKLIQRGAAVHELNGIDGSTENLDPRDPSAETFAKRADNVFDRLGSYHQEIIGLCEENEENELMNDMSD